MPTTDRDEPGRAAVSVPATGRDKAGDADKLMPAADRDWGAPSEGAIHAPLKDQTGNAAGVRFTAIVIMLALLAVLIRTVKFGIVPGGMNQDGVMAAVDAAALAEYGTDRLGMKLPVHLTAWGFGQMSALMSYLMVPFMKLFGLTPAAVRMPSLLVSLAGLAALYRFAERGFGKAFAVTILFLAAINPWHILQSRWALDCNLFPHFLILGLALLLKGTENGANRENGIKGRNSICGRNGIDNVNGVKGVKGVSRINGIGGNRIRLVLSAVAFGLSMYCYGIAVYTVPALLLSAFIYLLVHNKVTVRDGILYAVIYLLIAWPFLLCMIINFLGLETIETPFFTIPYFPYTLRSGDILFFSDHPLAQLRSNLLCTLRILLQVYGGSLCNEVKGFGTMYVFSVPFMMIGAAAMFRRFRSSTAAGLTSLLFLTGLLDGLITANVNINRINLIFYPLILFTATGAAVLVKAAERLAEKWRGVENKTGRKTGRNAGPKTGRSGGKTVLNVNRAGSINSRAGEKTSGSVSEAGSISRRAASLNVRDTGAGIKVSGLKTAVECGIAVLFLSGFVLFTRAYFTDYAEQISDCFMEDFGEAVTTVKDSGAETFYITPDAQYEGYWYVSEVLTLFYHEIDAQYYQSPAFRQKYRFENPVNGIPDEQAVYVTTAKYAGVFEGTGFTVTQYGRFITAVPASAG